MANEISITATLTVTKSGVTVAGSQTKQLTLTGVGQYAEVQAIGTSAEVIAFPGDLTTEGISQIWLKNLDATNYIEIALDSGMTNKIAKINAGETCGPFRPYATNPTYYARANTASCNLQVVAAGT